MNLNASPPILIVVDEPIVAKELQQSLLAKGYDAIVVAASADQAIASASRAHPDALQMDIRSKGLVDWIELTVHKRELESALLESRQQIRDMTQRLEMVREQERHAIAVLLHDGIAQELFAVKLGLHQLRALAKKRRSVKSLCSEMELAIVQCMESTRFAVIELRPVALAYSPLSSVIAEYARHFGERSNLDVRFTEAGELPQLSEAARLLLFRAAQETLTNVARHAHATTVEIALRTDGGQITMQITDDGVGIMDGAMHKPCSLGLLGLRERCVTLGGGLTGCARRIGRYLGDGVCT